MNTQARAISRAMSGGNYGGSDSRALLAGNHASAEAARAAKARRARVAEMAAAITARCVVTPSQSGEGAAWRGVMEFTSPASPILPVAVVTARLDVDAPGEMLLTAEAGPGRDLAADTLEAFVEAAAGRIEANKAERQAREGGH